MTTAHLSQSNFSSSRTSKFSSTKTTGTASLNGSAFTTGWSSGASYTLSATFSSEAPVSTSDFSGDGSAPAFNLNNITCQDLVNLNSSQQWAAVEGDNMVETFNTMFDSNQLVCLDCFGMSKSDCKSKDPDCLEGLADLAVPEHTKGQGSPRWDTAAALFAQDADITDLICEIGTSQCSGAPSCYDCDGPGAFALLKSLSTLHNTLQNIYDAIGQAGALATDQMTVFQSLFAPVPSLFTEALWIGIITQLLAGLFGVIPLVGPALSVLVGIGGGVMMDFLIFKGPIPPDPASYLGVIVNQTQLSYSKVTSSLFQTGKYEYSSADGKTQHTLSMATYMQEGQLMKASADPKDFLSAMVPVYERIMFQQLAQYTWAYLEVDSKKHTAYISFDNQPCEQVDPNDKTTLSNSRVLGVSKLDANMTYDGRCYYLLDAYPWYDPNSATDSWPRCHGEFALPGGTNAEMKEHADIFGQLSIADFIIPSVKGWEQNAEQNGYPLASYNGQLVSDPQDAAAVNFPVCDYLGNFNDPGISCPKLGEKTFKSKSCAVYPASSGQNQPGDFTPGRCGVHVDQFQKHDDNSENPLDSYQLSVTVLDSASRPVGQATMQSAASPLEITDTSLPYNLIVYPGATDSDHLSFWYSDQFWLSNSSANQCNFKDNNYDNGERQGDCSFDCPLPQIATSLTSATKDHPLPTPAVPAIAGYTTFLNTWAETPSRTGDPSATSTTSTFAATTPTYATGQCRVHIEQFQKNEPHSNPTGDYELDVTIYSGNEAAPPLFNSGQLPFPEGKNISVKGLVSPLTIMVPIGCLDSWGINMAFAGQSWVTNATDQCNAKPNNYDSGHRDFDCDFDC